MIEHRQKSKTKPSAMEVQKVMDEVESFMRAVSVQNAKIDSLRTKYQKQLDSERDELEKLSKKCPLHVLTRSVAESDSYCKLCGGFESDIRGEDVGYDG